jgi:vacuolar iron transporter family protein
MKTLSKAVKKKIVQNQKDEITGYHIYRKLARRLKDKNNAQLLDKIAQNELDHYKILERYSRISVRPSYIKILFYYFISIFLGLTFSLKLLEKGEKIAGANYRKIKEGIPEVQKIMEEEDRHENELLNMLNETRLNYMGSVVLGLNDALVELTGALAGYTFAMQNSRLIAVIGLITGIAASLSMASSEFLSKKHEGEDQTALLSSFYTGIAYIITVVLLILPFLLFQNHYLNLLISVSIAIFIIYFFNFYISTAKDLPFMKRFLEMVIISLSVTLISFGIGYLVKTFIGVDL